MLVSTVMAHTAEARLREEIPKSPLAGTLFRQDCIMSAPPLACTVNKSAPAFAMEFAAP